MRYLISTLLANLLFWQPAFATFTDVDKSQVFNKNLLVNGGFESGKAKWTPNDTADFTTSTTTPLEGLTNAEWDADASTDTLTSTAVTIPSGWYGRNGVASCLFVTPSGTATHEIQAYDGSNVLSEATITSSTSPTRTSTNFIFPSSGSISLRIYANADEPNLEIDSCFLAPSEAFNVSSVSQATFVGGMDNAGASTCTYLENTSTGLSDFDDLTTGASCAAWTVVSNGPGTISAQGTNDHRLVYTNMPPGNYIFRVVGTFGKGAAAGGCMMQLSDGTTSYQPQYQASGDAVAMYSGMYEYSVTVTTAATRTYKLAASDNHASFCEWYNAANHPASWKIYRFPTSSEQAYTPDLQAMSWSGYHDDTCSWARANTALGDPTADASCALVERTNQNFGTVSTSGSVLPAITFTPKKAGRYYVCANLSVGGTAETTVSAKFWDGTTTIASYSTVSPAASGVSTAMPLCGVYVASNTSAKTLSIQTAVSSGTVTIEEVGVSTSAIEWSIFSLDQSLPAPVLTNMVTTGSSGGIRVEAVYYNCDGSSAITSQTTSGVFTAISNISTGICNITIASGVFSSAPYCSNSVITVSSNVEGGKLSAAPTTTNVSAFCTSSSAACPSYDGQIICIGAR